jgi:ribonuclease P protein component
VDKNSSIANTNSSRHTFPHRMRLSRGAQFMAVYESKARASIGPLMFHARPNELRFPRLGLAVSRRVGNAVKRNAIKRRLREAFRLLQHELPRWDKEGGESGGAYDLIVSAKAHDPLPLAEYQSFMQKAMEQLHKTWSKKLQKRNLRQPPPKEM